MKCFHGVDVYVDEVKYALIENKDGNDKKMESIINTVRPTSRRVSRKNPSRGAHPKLIHRGNDGAHDPIEGPEHKNYSPAEQLSRVY